MAGGRLRHAGDAVHRHYHRGAGRIPAGHLGRTAHAGHGILSGVASPSACDGCGGPVQPLADQRGRIHRHCELAAGRPASPAPNSCGSRKWTTWPPRGRWARENAHHHVPGHPAQRHPAAGHRGHPDHFVGHPVRVWPELPWPRRPQHHDMGHDHRLQQGLYHEFLVGGHVPRPGHFPCGTCHRADRRRHQRCVQPRLRRR